MESRATTGFSSATPRRPRLVCFFNGSFVEAIGGGDTYFHFMIRAALQAGYPVHFFGGHAFKGNLVREGFPRNITLTDDRPAALTDVGRLSGQIRLLLDFFGRFRRTMPLLDEVKPDDIAYAGSDYWFDVIPLIRCKARAKILYLGMTAPTLIQILFKGRPDVTALRLPSLYYWMSQQLSLRWFRRCQNGVVTYSHPEMREYLMKFGYDDSALWYLPNGSDVVTADRVPAQQKEHDVVWAGRVHPQKGIDDLLATLLRLKQSIPDFRAVIIGRAKESLEPLVKQMGIAENITFSGLVSEEEKFRLLKASRVFVMPSRYESWGIVVGEALVSEIPVVAYKLSCYEPVFGDFVRYVPPFDIDAFKHAVEDEIRNQRAGRNYLATLDVSGLKKRLSWAAAQENFKKLLDKSAADGTTKV